MIVSALLVSLGYKHLLQAPAFRAVYSDRARSLKRHARAHLLTDSARIGAWKLLGPAVLLMQLPAQLMVPGAQAGQQNCCRRPVIGRSIVPAPFSLRRSGAQRQHACLARGPHRCCGRRGTVVRCKAPDAVQAPPVAAPSAHQLRLPVGDREVSRGAMHCAGPLLLARCWLARALRCDHTGHS